MKAAEILEQLINEAERIVFFGGAGVSTGSGIPDFRSATGLYNRQQNTNYSPEEMLSYSFMVTHPEEFYTYKRENLYYPDATPNLAHLALARLEANRQDVTVITQNIDGLHQAAGSKNVLEIHGSMQRFYCMKCHRDYPAALVWEGEGVPLCPPCGGMIRPDVVLYGEMLDQRVMAEAQNAIRRADLMIVGGTSLVVYPAAGLLQYFRGKALVLINRDPTPYDHTATYVFHEELGELLDEAIQ
ncbi:MAG: NAD-dependent protein deacylase [Anaerolineaceae bacterium]|jgi:NAD-dependent deacetylase|nr:NAD-dependent protein deacylase [Anaerolineaceae bacterium]MDD4042978.1 NAD-dependent protein deacylase [Anaerolineaceae bacterium]